MAFVVLKMMAEKGKCLAAHKLKQGIHIWHCLNFLQASSISQANLWQSFLFHEADSEHQWLAASH